MANLHPNQLANQLVRSGQIVVGVGTHKHVHVAAVMGSIGGIQAIITVATDTGGFRQMLETGLNPLVKSSRSESKTPGMQKTPLGLCFLGAHRTGHLTGDVGADHVTHR